MKYRVTSDFFCSYFYHAGIRQSRAARDHVRPPEFDVEAVYASMAAIVLLQGALESYINYAIYEHGLSDRRIPRGARTIELLEASIKEKWQHVPLMLCGQGFAEDQRPYTEFVTLVDLRNELMHFKSHEFSCEVDIPSEYATADGIRQFLSRPKVLAAHILYDILAVGIVGPTIVRAMVKELHAMLGSAQPRFLDNEELLTLQPIH